MTASSKSSPAGCRAYEARPAAMRAAAWLGVCRAAEGLARLGRLHGAVAPRLGTFGSRQRDRWDTQDHDVQAGGEGRDR